MATSLALRSAAKVILASGEICCARATARRRVPDSASADSFADSVASAEYL